MSKWDIGISGNLKTVEPERYSLKLNQIVRQYNDKVSLVYDYDNPNWLGLILHSEFPARVHGFQRPSSKLPASATTGVHATEVQPPPEVAAAQAMLESSLAANPFGPGSMLGSSPALPSPEAKYLTFIRFESLADMPGHFQTIFDVRLVNPESKVAEIKGHAIVALPPLVTDDGLRMVASYSEPADTALVFPSLWDLKKQARLKLLVTTRRNIVLPTYHANLSARTIITYEIERMTGSKSVCTWRLDDGKFLGSSELPQDKAKFVPYYFGKIPFIQFAAPPPSNEVYVVPEPGVSSGPVASSGWRRHPIDFRVEESCSLEFLGKERRRYDREDLGYL